MSMKQEFYKDDVVYLELSEGVHAKVKILEVKFAYGNYRYVVKPIDTEWQMTVEHLHKNRVLSNKQK